MVFKWVWKIFEGYSSLSQILDIRWTRMPKGGNPGKRLYNKARQSHKYSDATGAAKCVIRQLPTRENMQELSTPQSTYEKTGIFPKFLSTKLKAKKGYARNQDSAWHGCVAQARIKERF